MTQLERLEAGLVYDTCDKEILENQGVLQERMWELNRLNPTDREAKQAYLKEMFAECGEYCYIELPFYANWGGSRVHFGTGVYANYNLTMIDDGHIYVGNRVLFGPNVVVSTGNHPLDPELRKYEMSYAREVHIGDNVWIGAGAIILPGVTIGKNSVIGAGSVVTRDIPENSLAIGTPCRVVRPISEHDRECFFHSNDRIDWENLTDIIEKKKNHPKFQ